MILRILKDSACADQFLGQCLKGASVLSVSRAESICCLAAAQTCANCQFTTTPLWRKDRVSGMIMCNACSIYYKNHGKHRPLELIEQSRIAAGACCSATHGPNAKAAPSRGSAHPGAHDAHNEPAAPPALPPIKTEVRRLTQSHSTPSCLKRCASPI